MAIDNLALTLLKNENKSAAADMGFELRTARTQSKTQAGYTKSACLETGFV